MTEFEKSYLRVCEKIKRTVIPYKTNLKKIRIGDECDGGYVVAELPGYEALYSYGSNDQTGFERQFNQLYGTDCYVYDHTIDGITDKPDFMHFFKEGVSHTKTHNMDTIDHHIEKNGHTENKNLMGQIDIEGHEDNFLSSTLIIFPNLLSNFIYFLILCRVKKLSNRFLKS